MKTATAGKAFLIPTGFAAIAAIAMAGAGCDNNHLLGAVDSGSPANDGGATTDVGPPPGMDASGLDVPKVDPTESWTGYVENYKFHSGSDTIKIAFTADASGHLIGTVTLGNGTPPPPPTDPSVGYPADFVSQQGFVAIGQATYIAEGYPYTMQNGLRTGRRLQFIINLWELWTAWCAIETPAGTSGACVPNTGYRVSGTDCALINPATNQFDMPIDCGKLMLCAAGVCLCDPATSRCALNDSSGAGAMFDVTITSDGSSADGSEVGLGTGNVHFTKDP